jgi:hypothetical protein
MMLVIQDNQISMRLQQIAAAEQRPVEDVLRSLLATYPAAESIQQSSEDDTFRPGTSAWIIAHLDEASFSTPNPIDPTQSIF